MFSSHLRRKRLSTFHETIVVKDGTISDVGRKPFRNPHVSWLDIWGEGKRPLLNDNPAQQLDVVNFVPCLCKSITRTSTELRIHALHLSDEVLLNRFSSLRHHPVEIAKADAFSECKSDRIIDYTQSFQKAARKGFEVTIISRLKSKPPVIKDECMRLFKVAKQELFLSNRACRSRRRSILASEERERDDVLALKIRVACLTEALLDAGQEVTQFQNRIKPHLRQSQVYRRILEWSSHCSLAFKCPDA